MFTWGLLWFSIIQKWLIKASRCIPIFVGHFWNFKHFDQTWTLGQIFFPGTFGWWSLSGNLSGNLEVVEPFRKPFHEFSRKPFPNLSMQPYQGVIDA